MSIKIHPPKHDNLCVVSHVRIQPNNYAEPLEKPILNHEKNALPFAVRSAAAVAKSGKTEKKYPVNAAMEQARFAQTKFEPQTK